MSEQPYVREYRLPHWPPGAKITILNEPSERALEHYRQLSVEIARRAVERGYRPSKEREEPWASRNA